MVRYVVMLEFPDLVRSEQLDETVRSKVSSMMLVLRSRLRASYAPRAGTTYVIRVRDEELYRRSYPSVVPAEEAIL